MSTIIDQSLNGFSFNSGHKDMIKKTKKKTMPKLRLEFILIFELFCINHYCIFFKLIINSVVYFNDLPLTVTNLNKDVFTKL